MKLRLLVDKDAKGMLDWMHDPKVNCFFRFRAEDMTEEKALAFIEQANNDVEQKKSYNFAITDGDDEYLGTISLKEVDWEARVAEYAISMRTKAQGRGLATKATNEILRYAFEELGLNRVFLNVLSDNEKAIHLYEKCGFQYEGLFKNHVNIRGENKSLRWYAVMKEEWEERTYGKDNA